ncbi:MULTISPECIES: methionine synthase [unclassified Haematospirillum]|uniref:methionine synthase n=1 Tax=unclassified Haematospirillum TaxID=2622088 RepID=UPI00143A7240|nr:MULTISPECIES: methionine synthase [unclassified Haematospirillum]NKD55025.1 methionine synthase [Haematospirillum sp. H4890]NKD75046.1 methionine synthase [Haematospirillum sp. H4485]NKD88419.1 methionine synthase [Haematospirillum sp. 15-248]
MRNFLNALEERVLLCDGAMGSLVQAMPLTVEDDYDGRENCTEVLNLTRPDVVRSIHERYFAAGADMVQSNTFGASPVTLAEFDLQDRAEEINRRAVEIAREAAEQFAGDGRNRFVLGGIGPGTKLPSLGHIDYDSLETAYIVQARGLIAGGCDAVLIETCQDPLQFKAAVNGVKAAREDAGRYIPILLQVTVETTGTLLVGTDIGAAATVAHALGVDCLGLNCATGPAEMAEHVRWLSENWPGYISLQPNAGLPELRDGKTFYPLTPPELASWHERFIREDGVNIVGSCCGSTPAHTMAVDTMLRRMGDASLRPAPVRRQFHWVPAVASLYSRVDLRQENAFLSIGERCNANGSKKFRQLQEAEDWDGAVAMGREQVREGSNTLDVCTAFVGRNETADMLAVVSRMRGTVNAPLVIDSTETPVIEAALKLYGGKAVINSINFEDGEGHAADRVRLARRFGASVIALTIDEDGMAKDCAGKVRVARRLYDFACTRHGLPASDLMFDPLTFTICTGNDDDRRLGMETLDAIEDIARILPECQIILGLSNISFGLKPLARQVLNSVFLHHAVKRGMTGAIVHVSKIMPLHKLAPEEVKCAEDLIFDRRAPGYDPLHAFIALFRDREGVSGPTAVVATTVEERLRQRIIDGDRQGLEVDLEEAMKVHPPLDIINIYLLDGMKEVGELFGAGQMQLPFVLQSAETMKAAVSWLEPFMEKTDGQSRGTLVLATVKGDVHDIGKNLVDIILTNNGYRVINLGIKQPVSAIIEAAHAHHADAIGMSGLLVKSTVIMKENLEEMARQGLSIPVMLGGAALTRAFVETDCSEAYAANGNNGLVAYARDAFDGLDLMAKVVEGRFAEHVEAARVKRAGRPSRSTHPAAETAKVAVHTMAERPVDWNEVSLRRQELAATSTLPVPPFWGAALVEQVPIKALVPYLNEVMLYQFQWGFRKQGRDRAEWRAWTRDEVRPILQRMLDICNTETILHPKAAYGYWKAGSEGDTVILFHEDGLREAARFTFPRQRFKGGLCLADFVRELDADGPRDVVALQVVTMGSHVSDVARHWFSENRYQDYLYLHGLSVEMAEAMAEYVHKRIRAELGFAAEDARDIADLLKQGYRGARYSFGYPACPNMADQEKLLDLLGAGRLGLEMSEGDQLHPEQSTSAIVLHHPQAKYFKV